PTELVKRGVIVVTVNYRLGALGFTAHPALTAETNGQTSGNYGFQAQQAALRWVQRNIRNFGCDPDNVTIFGESAGGVSVYTHLASPASAGLFHRAIAQSGTYAFAAPQTTRAAAEVNGQAFATALGCAAGDLACMRAAPVSTVLSKQSTSPVAYLPNIDGSLLPQATLVLLGTGQFNRVPVLQGTTHDEYRLFVATLFELQGNPVTTANYPLAIQAALGVNAATADALANIFYTVDEYETASLALGELGTDAIFACPSRQLARSMIAYVPMYLYEFSDQNAPQDVLPPVSFPYGAYHGAEVQYLLDSQDGAAAFTSAQTSLANHMKNYWTQFAKTGNPNGGTSPAWAVFVHRADNNFQQLIAPTPAPSSDDSWLLDHGCNFWNGF
ncbi:MAG TPA: carboxylesterase family protein, partial [Polyangiales bacterium]|nr:carboxylesterase family protein [Polyangiales bacterium]